MKRFFSLILVVFLLSQAISIAQQFRCELRPGAYTINRLEGIIWIDVDVANDFVVKEINFNDTITYNNSVIGANAIPAFCPKDDGSKDTNKYTRATPLSLNSDRFRYWMPEDPSLYLPVSANTRRIMKFYVKFVDQIPQYGEIKINFNNFSVIGVNNSATFALTTPTQSEIIINLGVKPPDENDSLIIRVEAGTVNRQTNEAKIKLFYKSKIFSFNKLSFQLFPSDLNIKSIALTDSIGRSWGLNRVGNYYEVNIANTDDKGFPPSADAALAEIIFGFDPAASGTRTIVLNNFQALDLANQPLKITGNLSQVIDLGQGQPPIITKDSIWLNSFVFVDSAKSEVRVNLSYWGKGWDTLAFNLNLPQGINLKSVNPALLSMNSAINGSRITISSRYLMMDAPMNQWHNALDLVFSYNGASGIKRLVLSNITAQRDDTTLVVANQPLIVDIDLGGNEDTTGLVVKYFLTQPQTWFHLDSRPADKGWLELYLDMDNVVETTDAINFRVVLPPNMAVKNISPVDLNGNPDNKMVDINFLGETGGKKYYAVVYSSLSSVLQPNPGSKNPRVIMKLQIEFTDLCPVSETILIDNIVASGLDGRPLVANKKTSWLIDFNPIFRQYFVKGDLDLNFGNLRKTIDDWRIMKDIIDKKIIPTCYQRWAADMNNDGDVNSLDLTILENQLFTDVSDSQAKRSQWQFDGQTINYQLVDEYQAELEVYNCLGQLIDKQESCKLSGQFYLTKLPDGFYLIKFNKQVGKIIK